MCSMPRVVDITKRKPGVEPVIEKVNPMNQLVEKTAALTSLQRAVTDVSFTLISIVIGPVKERPFFRTILCFQAYCHYNGLMETN